MGRLTQDMTRLSGEITARRELARKARADREAFVSHLEKAGSSMRNRFATDMRDLQEDLRDLQNDVRNLRKNVSSMLASFRKAHAKMAKNTSADRKAFVSGLKETVASLRRSVAGDIAGAHRAWLGLCSAEGPALERSKRQSGQAELPDRGQKKEQMAGKTGKKRDADSK